MTQNKNNMLKWLLKTYMDYFPERQLLIRQNGEVKYINVVPSLQLRLALVLGALLVWFSYSSIKYFTLNQKVILTNNTLQQSKLHLDGLSLQYKAKHSELEQQLIKLKQQQQFLQNSLDSLPEKIAPFKSLKDQVNSTADQQSKTTERLKTTTSSSSKNTTVLDVVQNIQLQMAQLELAQKNSFTQIEMQISHREQLITRALELTGITSDMLQKHYRHPTLAQGGPLYALPESNSSLSKNQLELTAHLLELNELEAALNNIPIKLPAKDYYISSLYGYRKDPILNRRAMHKGIDMAGWLKTEIFAPANGTVKRAGRNGSYGNFIEIDHLNGFTTRYGHLYKIQVKAGQKINKNDVIGLMGSTGRSTSTHLHYEVMFNNETINPLKLTRTLEDVL